MSRIERDHLVEILVWFSLGFALVRLASFLADLGG
jgi:hypothetical protein